MFFQKKTCAKDTGEENEIMLMESIHVYRFDRQKFSFIGRFKIMEGQKRERESYFHWSAISYIFVIMLKTLKFL